MNEQEKIKAGFTPEEIVTIRTALPRSQEGLAALLGTTQTTVSRWETGKSSPQPIYRKKLWKLREYIARREGGV